MTNSTPLSVCRYRFTVKVEQALKLPEYSGSMLRGAFGNALQRVACITRRNNGSGCNCPPQAPCPYRLIFETPAEQPHKLQKFSNLPNPYVIEPPSFESSQLAANLLPAGGSFQFNMVLIGEALAQLPLIILAWQRALEHGLSKTRSRCKLVKVTKDNGEPVYLSPASRNDPPGIIQQHNHDSPLPNSLTQPPTADDTNAHSLTLPNPFTAIDFGPGGQTIELQFNTPLRLQKNGKPLGQNELNARTLLMALVRRYHLLTGIHNPSLPEPDFSQLSEIASTLQHSASMRWFDWTRYSNRQQQKMTLGGLVGKLQLSGDLTLFLPYLLYGQWLHIGKNATLGMGGYKITQLHNANYHNPTNAAQHQTDFDLTNKALVTAR